MKQFVPFLAVALATAFVSCGPEEPNPPPSYERARGTLNVSRNHQQAHPCPNPGNGCIVIVPIRSQRTMVENEVIALKEAIDNNTTASYFNDPARYSVLFPELNYNESARNAIVNGTYEVAFIDSDFIGVYQNNAMTDANMVFQVFVNYDNL